MHTRFTTAAVSLAAIAAISVPAIAQARGGSDDPVNHVRREHHRQGSDDGFRVGRRGDDGPNHR